MTEELRFLKEQGVDEFLINEVEKFRNKYSVSDEAKSRIVKPQMEFIGKDILEMAISAILQGENILLSGSKATG